MKHNFKATELPCLNYGNSTKDLFISSELRRFPPLGNYVDNYRTPGREKHCHELAMSACSSESVPDFVLHDLKTRAIHDGRIEIYYLPSETGSLIGFTKRFCEAAQTKHAPLPVDFYSAAPYVATMFATGKNNCILTHAVYRFEYRAQLLIGSQEKRQLLFMDKGEDFMSLFMEGQKDNSIIPMEQRLLQIAIDKKERRAARERSKATVQDQQSLPERGRLRI